jgi:hypothetical protein
VKTKVYMRVARKTSPWQRTPFKVDASTSPNPRSLTTGSGHTEQQLHTLHFALELDIPDELLSPAKWPVIEVALGPDLVEQVPIEIEAVQP